MRYLFPLVSWAALASASQIAQESDCEADDISVRLTLTQQADSTPTTTTTPDLPDNYTFQENPKGAYLSVADKVVSKIVPPKITGNNFEEYGTPTSIEAAATFTTSVKPPPADDDDERYEQPYSMPDASYEADLATASASPSSSSSSASPPQQTADAQEPTAVDETQDVTASSTGEPVVPFNAGHSLAQQGRLLLGAALVSMVLLS